MGWMPRWRGTNPTKGAYYAGGPYTSPEENMEPESYCHHQERRTAQAKPELTLHCCNMIPKCKIMRADIICAEDIFSPN